MRGSFASAVVSAAMIAWIGSAAAAGERVVVSIKPIHSLVAGIMQDVGEPLLLVDGAGSPHTYSLKPSQAAALEQADLVYWIGPGLETFLEKPMATLVRPGAGVALIDTPGLKVYEYRVRGPEDRHADHEHDHDADKDGHAHGEDHAGEDGHAHGEDHAGEDGHAHGEDHAGEDGHAHGEGHADEDDHAHGHEHSHAGAMDTHIWLDPMNARVLVNAIASRLGQAYPDSAARIAANARSLEARLQDLAGEMSTRLSPVSDRPYIVFHDAYQYLERRFALRSVGAITLSPGSAPGAGRLARIREKVRDSGAVCVFAEPQFEPEVVRVVLEGSEARSAVLDPLGADIAAGPEHYFQMMRRNADALATCLGGDD